MHWQWFPTTTYVILLLRPQQDMWCSCWIYCNPFPAKTFYGNCWIYCNPFPAKTFYGRHRLDPVMIQPPGIDNRALVVADSWLSQAMPAPMERLSCPLRSEKWQGAGKIKLHNTLRASRPAPRISSPTDYAGRSIAAASTTDFDGLSSAHRHQGSCMSVCVCM